MLLMAYQMQTKRIYHSLMLIGHWVNGQTNQITIFTFMLAVLE